MFEFAATDQRLVWTAYVDDDGHPGESRYF